MGTQRRPSENTAARSNSSRRRPRSTTARRRHRRSRPDRRDAAARRLGDGNRSTLVAGSTPCSMVRSGWRRATTPSHQRPAGAAATIARMGAAAAATSGRCLRQSSAARRCRRIPSGRARKRPPSRHQTKGRDTSSPPSAAIEKTRTSASVSNPMSKRSRAWGCRLGLHNRLGLIPIGL